MDIYIEDLYDIADALDNVMSKTEKTDQVSIRECFTVEVRTDRKSLRRMDRILYEKNVGEVDENYSPGDEILIDIAGIKFHVIQEEQKKETQDS